MSLMMVLLSIQNGCGRKHKTSSVREEYKSCENKSTQLTLRFAYFPSDVSNNSITLRRSGEEYALQLTRGELCQSFISSSCTNKVYVVIVKSHYVKDKETDGISRGGDPERVDELTLPVSSEPLNSVKKRTLFRMDDLAINGERSWVSELLNISPDGRYLSVERSIPTKISEGVTHWDYETQIYDIERNEFKKPDNSIAVPINKLSSNALESVKSEPRPDDKSPKTP